MGTLFPGNPKTPLTPPAHSLAQPFFSNPPVSPLFYTDFGHDTDFGLWSVESGTWGILEGEMHQTSLTGDRFLTLIGTPWIDYTVSAVGRLVAPGAGTSFWWGIGFRRQDAGNRYFLFLGQEGGVQRIILGRVFGGAWIPPNWTVNLPGLVQTDKNELRVVIRGTRVMCYLNGVLEIDQVIPQNVPTGGIWLITTIEHAAFDCVKVERT